MKSSEVCALAIRIVAWVYGEVQYRMNNTTYYPDMSWNLLTWYNNAWHADCLGLVRAVLCGWNANKNVVAGGANTSYACYNYNEIMMLNSCSSTSTNFVELRNHPCSLLYKPGHVGIYVGEFQLDGLTYNSCECTTSFGWGGRPVWVDTDGQRKAHKDAGGSGSYWTNWGVFNTRGTDYGITEYDGGATGATGFGSELSKEEVEYYWDTLPEITYSQCEALAESFYEMPAGVFSCLAGWVWGEDPAGFDEYMNYLAACEPINYFMAYNATTPQQMANAIAGNDHGGYYSLANLNARAANLHANETTPLAQRALKAIYLALCNPNQLVVEVHGVGSPAAWRIIYEITVHGQRTFALKSLYGDRTYDITGTGIRGGMPDPGGRTPKGSPIWMWLRPYYRYNQYIRRNY